IAAAMAKGGLAGQRWAPLHVRAGPGTAKVALVGRNGEPGELHAMVDGRASRTIHTCSTTIPSSTPAPDSPSLTRRETLPTEGALAVGRRDKVQGLQMPRLSQICKRTGSPWMSRMSKFAIARRG